MSTNRRLRRARVTHHELRKPQKPFCKVADAPEDARRFVRYLIRRHVKQSGDAEVRGITQDELAAEIEGLIDKGEAKIILYQPPKGAAKPKDIRYKIIPTGKH